MHIVLLGDSVFDNAPYTAGGPAVIDHLRGLIGPGEEATLLAVDGHQVQDVWSQAVDGFAEAYWHLLEQLKPQVERLQVCTIYNGNFGAEAPILSSAVRLFDDAIQRAALAHALPVVELRDLLNRPEHYANPIEPSVEGGRVLAEEIVRRVRA